MGDEIVQLVTILFLLSMVCERMADFLKHYLCGSKIFGIKDTLTRNPDNALEEKEREYRIMKINVWSGIIIAAIIKADMIMLFKNMDDPASCLGWNTFSENYQELTDYIFLIPGIVLTGCFISFGSKFWHDFLDIIYQIKNAKRVASDIETRKIDNIKDMEKAAASYESMYIQSAYHEAKAIYMANTNVKAVSIKSDGSGYYFEITVQGQDASIIPYYTYKSTEGLYHTIRVKIVVLGEGDVILAHGIDLSSRIFDSEKTEKWGTLGVLVKPLGDVNTKKKFLLTCCHNVISPLTNLPYSERTLQTVTVSTLDGKINTPIGTIREAIRDREADAALIEVDDAMAAKISKYIPETGTPIQPKELDDDHENKITAYMYGAKTGPEKGRTQGIVTSVYSTIKVTYNSTEEFEIINTIAISDNGKAISQRGDSGACVVDGNYNVLGIVVAGSSEVTYVLPIGTLLSKLHVKLA